MAVENGDTEEDPLQKGIDDFAKAGNQEKTAVNNGRSGFRGKLQKLTGKSGDGSDAHHVFPVKFEELFRALGIFIHDPLYGAWWESSAHHHSSHEYNLWWDAFFGLDGVTRSDAFALADFLAEYFGFETNY